MSKKFLLAMTFGALGNLCLPAMANDENPAAEAAAPAAGAAAHKADAADTHAAALPEAKAKNEGDHKGHHHHKQGAGHPQKH